MHLNCHTYYSFRYGTLGLSSLLEEAERCKIQSLALTDINNTSGILDFIRQAEAKRIKPVAGIDFRNATQQECVGLAINNEGFYELNKFLTECISSGEPVIPKDIPEFFNAFIIYPFGRQPDRPLRENEFIGVRPRDIYRVLFSEWKNKTEKMVALCPVTFQNGRCATTGLDLRNRTFNIHRLLRAIDNNTLLTKIPAGDLAAQDETMLTEEEIRQAFELLPQLPENARRLLEQCHIQFETGVNRNRKHYHENAETDYEALRSLCYEGMLYRYGAGRPDIEQRIEKELEMVMRMGFASYFLINHDIVNYAHHKGFFYVGRGSGANSVLAYCLRITDVDPVDLDLYFERFINEHRKNPPDFDIDFSWKDRDEIINYIFTKYGRQHTALLATYSTFQYNALIRELGKVYGLPKNDIEEIAGNRKDRRKPDAIEKSILRYSKYMHDFPNHLSIHAGGILISEKPMNYYTALSSPPKGFPLTQFSMLEAEDIGLYKFDILSQRGLGHIRDTVALVKQNKGDEIDIHDIKRFKEDKKISERIRDAKCMGCFYVESPAMRMLLKKLRAQDYKTLVAASSIIRPGVAQSGMMREYILRFHNPERMHQTPPEMLELLKETFGVMVYQEDVIKVAHFFAKLSLAEADMLRRGMSGKFRAREEFQKVKDKFISNCLSEGHSSELAHEVWRQIESFAGYSFSKGHSASYAVESYQSLFLKSYYPFEFMVGVINNFGGFYRTEDYVHEARMNGATIHPPCVNNSEALTVIIDKTIYLGMGLMSQLEQNTIEKIINERKQNGKYLDLADFMKRLSISKEQLRLLIRAGAFSFTGIGKKQLLWDMLTLPAAGKRQYVYHSAFEPEPLVYELPPLDYSPYDDALDEIEVLGFPLCSPFDLLKEPEKYTMEAVDLTKHIGKTIEITGYFVNNKHATTVRGESMMFGTFTDRAGHFFDTTHFPKVAERFPFRGKAVYLIKGKVAEEFGFVSIDVESMEKLPYAFGN